MNAIRRWIPCAALLVSALAAIDIRAQTLSAAQRAAIDSAAREVIVNTGAPSASVAIVIGGKLAYTNAYGNAILKPYTPAKPTMRYSIGSISKQFTATAVLLLAEAGKLALDDKVAKWLPQLTRANDVTIRQLLSMTSGYQDYWPQDYVMPFMLKPATAQTILDGWARKPLDFEPGSKWQYSNTNYVIAGQIVEKVSGMPLVDFLTDRVFVPLKMTSVMDIDAAPLGRTDAAGYMRYAVAPVLPAPKEGKGWLQAAGELAMRASDLAAWDISMMNQTLLKPASYKAMQTDVLLNNGAGTRYGLGVSVNMVGGRRQISHGGEVSGYTARNEVYPDEKVAIVVFANLDATGATSQIAARIQNVIFAATDAGSQKALAQARKIFSELQQRRIDRTLFSENANAYFDDQALSSFASSLSALGPAIEFVQTSQGLRGGMVSRSYRIKCGPKLLNLTTFTLPNGKLEQFQVARAE